MGAENMADEDTDGATSLPRKPDPAVVATVLEKSRTEIRERRSRALPLRMKQCKARFVEGRRRYSKKRKA
jgi:hypothetical protein